MFNVNYISNGKWYVHNRSDIFTVHSLLKDFYNDTLKPTYGKSSVCDLEYDKELQILRLRRYGTKGILNRTIVIPLSENQVMNDRVVLLLNSLAASGILNAPFCLARLKFKTMIGCIRDLKDKDFLVTKECSGRNRGYYFVKGELL